MNAIFAFQVAIGVIAFKLNGATFYTDFVTLVKLYCFNVISLFFTVPDVHAHEHIGPIVTFGSSGTCIDPQDGSKFIFFLPKHVSCFESFDKIQCFSVMLVDIGFCSFAHLEKIVQNKKVFHALINLFESIGPDFDRTDHFHLSFSFFGVGPEVRILSF